MQIVSEVNERDAFSERSGFDHRNRHSRIRREQRINEMIDRLIQTRSENGVHCSRRKPNGDLAEKTVAKSVSFTGLSEGRRRTGEVRVASNVHVVEPDDEIGAFIARQLRLMHDFVLLELALIKPRRMRSALTTR